VACGRHALAVNKGKAGFWIAFVARNIIKHPLKRRRRSLRLSDYDYSQPGGYFLTMVTRGREPLFGDIHDGEMHLHEAGRIVWDVWNALPVRYPQVTLGRAVVMPDHFHGIVIIHEQPIGVAVIHELPLPQPRRRMTLPLVVGYFKMNTAKRINDILGSKGMPVWQRNYYEHIIRTDEEHNKIDSYIEANVAHWNRDDENPIKSM
jgi:putative transposase